MKEWICRELSTSTGNSENGVLMMETELIRCKNCKHWSTDDGMFKDIDERQWHHCPHLGIDTDEYFYCREAEKKEEKDNKVVPLSHEDIRFNSEEDEKAYYEALAEREDEYVTTNDKTIRND